MSSREASETQRPSPLACVKCRAKHLKCDGKSPVCSRCQKHGLVCSYVRSRRGLRAPKDQPLQVNAATRPPLDPALWCEELNENGHVERSDLCNSWDLGFNCLPTGVEFPGCLPSPGISSVEPLSTSIGAGASSSRCLGSVQSLRSENTGGNDDMLIDLFYTHFHPTHPFVIPRRLLRQKQWTIPENLRTAIVFAGSHFTQTLSDAKLRERAVQLLHDQGPEDGHHVQALLLLTLTFHGRCEERDCLTAFQKATELALKLKMFDRSFATMNDCGESVVAESWQRTWWELVSVDVLLPTFHPRQYESRLQGFEADLDLPSEEQDYASCRPNPEPRSLLDFSKRVFVDDGYQYSSFSYKIEATRLLHSVRLFMAESEDVTPQSIDSSLSSFFLSLPPGKREVVGMDGSVDEVLFSAHLITNIACVLFHRSHSSFAFTEHHQPTPCTRQEPPKTATFVCPYHTSKALGAADSLSNAIGAHLALKRRSPFLTCAVALASSIHIPAYMMPDYAKERPVLKERLQLSISALQMIGEVWVIAQVVKAQVSKSAREVLFGGTLSEDRNSCQEVDLQCAASVAAGAGDDSWLDHMSGSGLLTGEDLAIIDV